MFRFIVLLVVGFVVFQIAKRLIRGVISPINAANSAFNNFQQQAKRRAPIDQIPDTDFEEIDSKLNSRS